MAKLLVRRNFNILNIETRGEGLRAPTIIIVHNHKKFETLSCIILLRRVIKYARPKKVFFDVNTYNKTILETIASSSWGEY